MQSGPGEKTEKESQCSFWECFWHQKTFYLIIIAYNCSSSYHNFHEFLVRMALKWQEIEFMQVLSSSDSFQSMPEIMKFFAMGKFSCYSQTAKDYKYYLCENFFTLNILNCNRAKSSIVIYTQQILSCQEKFPSLLNFLKLN